MTAGQVTINVYDHCTVLGNKRGYQCNYCGKSVSGITRIKQHLGGVGKDVLPCLNVAEDLREIFKNMLLGMKRENLTKRVGSLSRKRNLCSGLNDVERVDGDGTQTSGAFSGMLAEMSSVEENNAARHFASYNGRISSKVSVSDKANKDLQSREVVRCIGRFFYETGIDFSAVDSPSFQRMINAALGNDQVKYYIPSAEELKGQILQREVKEMQEHVNKIRNSWATTGCSVLLDGWVDNNGRNLVNFIAECPAGTIYLRSADVSAIVDNTDALHSLLQEVIRDVGVDNVVQFVACSTVGWMGAIGKHFMEWQKTVFWTVSASHCIELILEKIGKVVFIRDILEKAKIITKFIYGHVEVLKLMRNYANSWDLVKASKMKLAVLFLTLENIVSEKKHLKKMFASLEWTTSILACSPEGVRVAQLVGDISFWSGAEMALKATVPLLNVMRLINVAHQPQVGYIYEAMDQVKETIKSEFKNTYSHFNPIWNVIDEIWDDHLHSPLHAAAYFLNPSLFYSTDFHIDSEVAFGLLCSIVRMVQDKPTQDLISLQFEDYRKARGAFKDGSAVYKRTHLSPAQWWSTYGEKHPELQRFAIRLVSQTCDGALKYGLKRELAEKLLMSGRNPIEQQRLSDLAFVHYNLQLQNIKLSEGDDLAAEDIDPMDDWIVTESPRIAPKSGDLERMESEGTNASCVEGPGGIQAKDEA